MHTFEIITTTILYYIIDLKHLSYCWMPDLNGGLKAFDGMPTLPLSSKESCMSLFIDQLVVLELQTF